MIWNLPSKKLKCSLCQILPISCHPQLLQWLSSPPRDVSSILASITVSKDMMKPSRTRSLEAVLSKDFNTILAHYSDIFTQKCYTLIPSLLKTISSVTSFFRRYWQFTITKPIGCCTLSTWWTWWQTNRQSHLWTSSAAFLELKKY